MEAKHPQRVAALVALLAVVCLPGASSLLRAQDAVLRAPEGPQLETLPEATPTPYPDPAADLSSPLPQSSSGNPASQSKGFWIVSSRHCPNPTASRRPNCPLRYYYVGPDRRIRIASQQLLVESLPPGSPVCVVVHGSFQSWETIAMESSGIYDWLMPAACVPTNLVFFTWPSDKPNSMLPPVDFAILGCRSENHGLYLSQFISSIPADRPVSLIGHSHGTRTIMTALHLRAGGEVDGIRTGRAADLERRIRVVFVAAALDNDWLNPGARYGMAVQGTESIVNLWNRDDVALAWYPFRRAFSGQALAKTGFTPRNRRALGEWSQRVSDLDVSHQIRTGHRLHNYLTHPQIARSIAPTLFYHDSQPPEVLTIPSQAAEPAQSTSVPVMQRRGSQSTAPAAVRETFSNIGRSRPPGRQ